MRWAQGAGPQTDWIARWNPYHLEHIFTENGTGETTSE